jgi:hypothetical protein
MVKLPDDRHVFSVKNVSIMKAQGGIVDYGKVDAIDISSEIVFPSMPLFNTNTFELGAVDLPTASFEGTFTAPLLGYRREAIATILITPLLPFEEVDLEHVVEYDAEKRELSGSFIVEANPLQLTGYLQAKTGAWMLVTVKVSDDAH